MDIEYYSFNSRNSISKVDSKFANYQPTISDLATIRTNATNGNSALTKYNALTFAVIIRTNSAAVSFPAPSSSQKLGTRTMCECNKRKSGDTIPSGGKLLGTTGFNIETAVLTVSITHTSDGTRL